MSLEQTLPADSAVRASTWRQALLALGLVLLALLLGYRDTAWAMVEVWQRSDTFAHAFVVPPISLWLIWRRRFDLQRLSPQPSLAFAPALLAAALAWLLGDVASINALTQAALVAMLVLAVPLVLGRQVAGEIAFPLVFLLFCVPVGEFMMPTLMEATADFTVAALRLSGIPVFREGLQFVIPSGYWSVVEACSGLRYLIASVMVGALFAYLNYRSLRRRTVFIVVATLLPLVANWLRAYLIVMLGHLSGNRLAAGADHLIYGWVFFGVIMMALFMIGSRWAEPDAEPVSTTPAAIVGGQRASWPAGLAALLIVLAPLLLLRVLDARQPAAAPVLAPPELAGWQSQQAGSDLWQPIFQNPAAQQSAVYGRAGRQIGLHLAYYRHQGYGSKLVSSSNQLVASDDKHWARVSSSLVSASAGSETLSLRSSELRGAVQPGMVGERLQVWQFYWVDGRLTASDVRAKLYGVLQRLSGRGDDGAAVTLYTAKDMDNPEAAEQALKSFLAENWSAIAAGLERAKSAKP